MAAAVATVVGAEATAATYEPAAAVEAAVIALSETDGSE